VPLLGLVRIDMVAVFNWIGVHLPGRGTKIEWQRVHEGHTHWHVNDGLELTSMASSEICQRIRPGSWVEHVGDGLSPYGVRFTDYNATEIVAALLEIPEHHYFLAEDRSWIVVVTTEGDLDVVDPVQTDNVN
jgi:hypothetical protein